MHPFPNCREATDIPLKRLPHPLEMRTILLDQGIDQTETKDEK